MLQGGNLPHSLLMVGPEGAGKELLAVELAARLNCETGWKDAGERCSSCIKISHLEHPDLHTIFPIPYGEWEKSLPVVIESRREDFFNRGEFGTRARSIGIDCTRRIIEAVSKQPFEGRRTVVIVCEAHMMTTEAQNAFLKLLEEPPASTVLILVTEHPDMLLPTIVSRCQEIRFDPLPADGVARFLETFRAVESGEAGRLASISEGSLRRALNFLDERFLEIRSDAEALLGLVAEGKKAELVAEAEAASQRYSREEVRELLDEAVIILRGIAVSPNGAPRDFPADLRKIGRASKNLGRNADVELTLVQLLLDLAGGWY
jgi:DNA polymerase-3 subunit delta'